MYAWHFALSSHSFTTNTDATNIVLFLRQALNDSSYKSAQATKNGVCKMGICFSEALHVCSFQPAFHD